MADLEHMSVRRREEQGGPEEVQDPNAGEDSADESVDRDDQIMARVLPWAVSIMAHVALVVLAFFIIWSVVQTPEEEDEPIIPIARLSKTPGAPVKMRQKQQKTKAKSSRRSPVRTNNPLSASRSTARTQSTTIGAVGGSPGGGNPLATGLETGAGESASFFGTGGNAKKIVYLIDLSGSMIGEMRFVIDELKRSINDLTLPQTFTVIFFQDDDVLEVPPRQMKPATDEIKRRTVEALGVDGGRFVPGRRGNPIPAFKVALKYRPDLIFILSDNITGRGRYEIDRRDLVGEIDLANKSGTAINAIQFMYPDTLERYGLTPTLKVIADRFKGEYNFISGRELGFAPHGQ